MGEMMTRKQLYLPKRLNQLLKRAARQRGISESEVIRQASEREEKAITYPVRESAAGWDEIIHFVNKHQATFAGQGKPVKWNRQELYEEPEAGK